MYVFRCRVCFSVLAGLSEPIYCHAAQARNPVSLCPGPKTTDKLAEPDTCGYCIDAAIEAERVAAAAAAAAAAP